MIWVLQFILCVIFLELFLFLDLVPEARSILTRSGEAARVFADAQLDDDYKESFMRRASVEMLKATGRIVLKIAVIGAVMFLAFLLVVALFPASREGMLAGLTSIRVIVVLTIATFCYAWARHAVRQ